MTLRSPLPSVFHRFDRVCDHPCHRPCQRLTSPIRSAFFDPPTPLGAIEALAAASVAASATVAGEGRTRDRKGPHHRQHATNAEPSTDPVGIMRARPRPTNRLTSLSTSSIALGSMLGSSAMHRVEIASLAPVCPIGGGISRAGANSDFHSVEADQARARRSTAGETAECAEMPWFGGKRTRHPPGWPGKPAPSSISTSPHFFAAAPKNSAPHPQTLISNRHR